MKWCKVLAVLALVVLAVSVAPSVARADEPDYSNPAVVNALVQQLTNSGANSAQLWQKMSPRAQTAILKYLRLEQYERSSIVTIVMSKAKPFSLTIAPEAGWYCGCYGVYNVQGPYQYYATPYAAMVRGKGPGTLTLGATRQVSNKWSATVGIKAAEVSAGVGFDVTWTNSWTYSYQTTVPSGQNWEIDAYNVFNRNTYDVYYYPRASAPYKAGTRTAHNFQGVAYVVRRVG